MKVEVVNTGAVQAVNAPKGRVRRGVARRGFDVMTMD